MFIITLSDVIILVIIAVGLAVLGIWYFASKRAGKPKKIKCVEVKPTQEEIAEQKRKEQKEYLDKLRASDPKEYKKVKRRLNFVFIAAIIFIIALCLFAKWINDRKNDDAYKESWISQPLFK